MNNSYRRNGKMHVITRENYPLAVGNMHAEIDHDRPVGLIFFNKPPSNDDMNKLVDLVHKAMELVFNDESTEERLLADEAFEKVMKAFDEDDTPVNIHDARNLGISGPL